MLKKAVLAIKRQVAMFKVTFNIDIFWITVF